MELKEISISQIEDVPAPESKARQLSLMELGQVQPIKLYLNGNGTYRIIDGRRRLADMKVNGQTVVLALVEKLSDDEATLQSLASNISRSSNPMSEARDIIALREKYTQQQIAQMMGVTQGFISQRETLVTGLIPELQDKLAIGEMVVSAARIATRLPVEEQTELIEEPTVKNAKRLLRNYQAQEVDLANLGIPDAPDDYTPSLVIPGEQVEQLKSGQSVDIEWNGLTLTVSANITKEKVQ